MGWSSIIREWAFLPPEVSLWAGVTARPGLIPTGLARTFPYRHNNWGEEGPAEFPPDAGPGANHLLDVVIESVNTYNIQSENRRDE